ncbi:MAG: FAD-dependent thymidylate synthase [Candidatus Micrarchaeota archaeon]|nr:FAD-dependent thymidylate synthase [Candidatus Micrarchaeota archaeon]
MDEFTPEQKALLSRFCTNTDSSVFALVNLPQVVCGALFSRYSRTTKSARRVLLEEFIQNPEMQFDQIVGSAAGTGAADAASSAAAQLVATQKAEQFYDRVLVGYGDDSVAELGGAHIACEDISNLATKFIQDARIGLSPLEKSTRYVYFHQKDAAGHYRYYRGAEIAGEADYTRTCDMLFDTYVKLQAPLGEYLKKKYPKGGDATDRAYESTIKAKVCDLLRGLLPAGTLTNTGMYGNGRAFEYLITRMYAADLPEVTGLAGQMQGELSKVIPSFVKRANDKYGMATQAYWKASREGTAKAAMALGAGLPMAPEMPAEVELLEFEANAEQKIAAAILFSQGMDYAQAKRKADAMADGQRKELLDAYVGARGNRRHKPGRAFEHVRYTFAICGNFGQYRDLQRHRMLTQERQLLTCNLGYDVPQELREAGLAGEFEKAMKEAREAYARLAAARGPLLAQYAVPMAYRLRWYFHLTLREAFHLIELRSMPQGHEDYRRVAVKMADEIARAHPRLGGYMKFVNRENVGLERLESEKKIDQKLAKLGK